MLAQQIAEDKGFNMNADIIKEGIAYLIVGGKDTILI